MIQDVNIVIILFKTRYCVRLLYKINYLYYQFYVANHYVVFIIVFRFIFKSATQWHRDRVTASHAAVWIQSQQGMNFKFLSALEFGGVVGAEPQSLVSTPKFTWARFHKPWSSLVNTINIKWITLSPLSAVMQGTGIKSAKRVNIRKQIHRNLF